jgi:prepilin-type N-terminal cleavage/methylation domain-containing protein/prepilin-type processing-associated H-X9-DG protein
MKMGTSGIKRRHSGGFTLIELLVSIAIIATLGSLAFGFAKNAYKQGQRAKCAGSLKALGVGVLSYAQDNDGKLPTRAEFHNGVKITWADIAVSYLEGTPIKAMSLAQSKNYGCPGTICTDAVRMAWNLPGWSIGYGINPNFEDWDPPATRPAAQVRLAAISRPSQVIYAADAAVKQNCQTVGFLSYWGKYRGVRTVNGVLTPRGNFNAGTAEQAIDEAAWRDAEGSMFEERLPAWEFSKSLTGRPVDARHNGLINWLFVDGHVETLRPDQIKEKNLFWFY